MATVLPHSHTSDVSATTAVSMHTALTATNGGDHNTPLLALVVNEGLLCPARAGNLQLQEGEGEGGGSLSEEGGGANAPCCIVGTEGDQTTTSQSRSSSSSSLEGDDAARKLYHEHNHRPPMRSAFFTMFPVFMAYAALVTLQGNLKNRIGITTAETEKSARYSFAVSLCYLGNLVFRLLHNIIFSPFSPRQRVYIAYVCLTTAIGMIATIYYWLDVKELAWVYVIYTLGGVGIGTFESNLISVITPLGHATKKWAQMGIPLGFNGVSVGAFILFACFPNSMNLQGAVYSAIAAANIVGLAFFKFGIPDIPFESSAKSLKGFANDVKEWRQWAPKLLLHAFALMVDMFCVSFASAIQQYIYNSSELPLFTVGPLAGVAYGGTVHTTIPKNVHRSVFNAASLIGDACGRKLAYTSSKHVNPLIFLLFSALGVAGVLSKQALLAPFGMLLIMFSNGSVYAFTTKYIDDHVPRVFNLIGLSFWLFVGDAGSFTGANIVDPIRDLIGSE